MASLTPPVLVGDLRIDEPLPDLNRSGRFESARLLIWLHDLPIGEAAFELRRRPLTAEEVAATVWPKIRDMVCGHCEDDGLPAPDILAQEGLDKPSRPPCARRLTAPEDGPHVTVAIATRHRTEGLLRCLDSVTRLDYPSFEVVIVDSAPTDDRTEAALAKSKPWPFPLRYVRVSRPGVAIAHNAALDNATGDILAITDDDVEVDRHWLSVLVRAFVDFDAACVNGLILPAELETVAQLLIERSGGFARGFTPHVYELDKPEPDPLFPFTAGRFGSGANMAFRTDWLRSQSGFDPATGTGSPARGGHDILAYLKVITGGRTLVYEPAAVVRHWHRREYEGMRRQAFNYGVGLGAYVAAAVAAKPTLLPRMIARTVPAARYFLSPRSAKNENREEGFPREIIWLERIGLLLGPAAYASSRLRLAAHQRAERSTTAARSR
ncbi:MAG: glycosyltransferase family 2 protein [Streptosporangiaceae bacterium]